MIIRLVWTCVFYIAAFLLFFYCLFLLHHTHYHTTSKRQTPMPTANHKLQLQMALITVGRSVLRSTRVLPRLSQLEESRLEAFGSYSSESDLQRVHQEQAELNLWRDQSQQCRGKTGTYLLYDSLSIDVFRVHTIVLCVYDRTLCVHGISVHFFGIDIFLYHYSIRSYHYAFLLFIVHVCMHQGCAQAYGFCAASHLDMVLDMVKEKVRFGYASLVCLRLYVVVRRVYAYSIDEYVYVQSGASASGRPQKQKQEASGACCMIRKHVLRLQQHQHNDSRINEAWDSVTITIIKKITVRIIITS